MSFLKEELSPFAVAEGQPGPAVPWEDAAVPRLAGFYRTLSQSLRRPGEFFGCLRGEGWAEPLAFGLITATIGLLASVYWHLLLAAAVPGLAEEGGAVVAKGKAAALMLITPGLALIHLGWGSLCLWGGAALCGVRKPFTAVWRLFCYAQGSMAACLIPILGGPVAAVWMLYLLFRGVQRGFGVAAGRALAAVLISLLLQFLIFLIFLGSLALLGLMGLHLLLG